MAVIVVGRKTLNPNYCAYQSFIIRGLVKSGDNGPVYKLVCISRVIQRDLNDVYFRCLFGDIRM